MKLWHQSRTELGRLSGYRQAMIDHFERVSEPGTTIDLHGLAAGTYESQYPTKDTRYLYFAYLHSLQILKNVQRAEREGYDAFLIMNLPESIQEEAQSLVDIPVVSYAQATMSAAAMLGRRFAILTMIDDFQPLYESHIERYGMGARAWGVASLGLDPAGVFAGFEDPVPVVTQVEKRVRELAQLGVDVVIPGEAPVSAVLSMARVARVDEVPVVDGLGVTVKFGEALASLAAVSGLRASKSTHYGWRPPAGRLAELETFYGLDRFDGPKRDEEEPNDD